MEAQGYPGRLGEMEGFADSERGLGAWSVGKIELRRNDSNGQSGDLGRGRRRGGRRRHAATVRRR